jgi:translation elongation factor P/translation initiation factor 5A
VTNSSFADYAYLREHAQLLFPGASIEVIHADDEVIHIDVNGRRFTFEITSDDEEYVFTDGQMTFRIPLMESPDEV